MGVKLKDTSGQMTVEFVVVFPVLIIIGVIAVNALLFFSECAAFDRITRDAIRVYACSPAYGQTSDQACAQIEQLVQEQFEKEYLSCDVSSSGDSFGQVRYTSVLTFYPTLFGMGMKSEVFGVALPSFTHSVSLTVDPYKPGVLI